MLLQWSYSSWLKCAECGKDYATSSNLSRHKQTHRSLDSGETKIFGNKLMEARNNS